jgi:hypothetical protein
MQPDSAESLRVGTLYAATIQPEHIARFPTQFSTV